MPLIRLIECTELSAWRLNLHAIKRPYQGQAADAELGTRITDVHNSGYTGDPSGLFG
jgi:hypothetical protein